MTSSPLRTSPVSFDGWWTASRLSSPRWIEESDDPVAGREDPAVRESEEWASEEVARLRRRRRGGPLAGGWVVSGGSAWSDDEDASVLEQDGRTVTGRRRRGHGPTVRNRVIELAGGR